MSTPLSSATSYCSPAQCLTFHDARQIGDLCSDTGTRLSPTDLLTDGNLAAALSAASGEVEAACLVGGKYTPTDLQALTGVSAVFLQRLVSDIAMWFLLTRRDSAAKITELYRSTQEKLHRLRLGEMIFGLLDQANAGLPKDQFVSQADIDQLNLNTTIARRFFGVRGKERRLAP